MTAKKKIDLENVEAVDVEFSEVAETDEVKVEEVKPEPIKLTLEEQATGLESKIAEVVRYQSFLSLVKMSDAPFHFETPMQGDKSKMVLNIVTKRTPKGHITYKTFEIDGRQENGQAIQGKWLGSKLGMKTVTPDGFDAGEQQSKMYLQMYESQLELVKSEISGETVDGVEVESEE